MSSSAFLRADDLAFAYRDRVVFDGLSLVAGAGTRLGLVGENGTGKSTLLRLLAGLECPQAGQVRRGTDLGFLNQELPFPFTARVADVLEDALAEIRGAARRLDRLTERLADRPEDARALEEYGQALEWAQAHDLWDADRRAKLVRIGLGLGDIDTGRTLDTLSGGQRSRLGLAALLIRQPETLLLDEPTNHLDDEAAEFLERHLAALPGTVVLASHDRVFLDAVCTDLLDLDPALGGPTRYGGGYSDYLAYKRAERARWAQRFTEEQAELRELRHAVAVTARDINHNRGPRDNAKMAYDFKTGRVQRQISRRVRNARQRLAELERDQVRKPPAPLRFAGTLTARPRAEGPALSLREVHVPGRIHIGRLDIGSSTRLLVTGGNGAGKSSLLAVLAGRLEPAAGTVHRRPGSRVGLLEQDVVFADPARTPRQIVAAAGAGVLADLGLLAPRDLDRPVGVLSTGQRRRLGLALLIADPPQVLLLDEPTNHISLGLAEELTAALDTAPGAVVIASHDRWLRRGWSGAHLALAEGEVAGQRPPNTTSEQV
ncbi:ABC-F family ATP-binding cassette domain-containing protein [Amycolatopsis cihanbeyliensis]|uniref:Macrolide transport system ATP-binding/permease protein n=1 Tax=Amycolatopsis cihanbeyliensis TaxID=1128664 RepID=A0A542DCG2_AMYCI|nr:ABC-F family ATP-binding cassette domain-containing protein [Amycolatopsis cihanbeyliensis]TQJ00761.1 macrolide transport system ATP-binding/permease protein [Amycolatopsis cihanbeyliensis]